jgi:hypothetical protein
MDVKRHESSFHRPRRIYDSYVRKRYQDLEAQLSASCHYPLLVQCEDVSRP